MKNPFRCSGLQVRGKESWWEQRSGSKEPDGMRRNKHNRISILSQDKKKLPCLKLERSTENERGSREPQEFVTLGSEAFQEALRGCTFSMSPIIHSLPQELGQPGGGRARTGRGP